MREAIIQSVEIRTACTLSYCPAGSIAVSNLGGVFLPETYARETASWAAQGIGQDVVNIVLVVPGLLLSAFLTQRGGRVFGSILAGTLVYSIQWELII